ncbi:MAG: redox-regulated ATPase YchF [Bacillota bacterium]
MRIGIVGLQGVGKSTLFHLLTGAGQTGHGGRQATIGMCRVPDARIDRLSEMYNPRKTIYAQMEVHDLPGLVPGAEGANAFLASVREVDALIQVVQVFDDPAAPHVLGSVDPVRDMEQVGLELIFNDMAVIEKKLTQLKEGKKTKGREKEISALEKLAGTLEAGRLISAAELSDEEREAIRSYTFLSDRPMVIAANLGEEALAAGDYPGKAALAAYCADHGLPLVEFSGRVEQELGELSPEERQEMMVAYGIDEPGVNKVARAIYARLGLISFFTVGPDEVRAWTIEAGTVAKRAAGKIHTDIEKGFIRAEVMSYEDLARLGSEAAVKAAGLWRLEGKDYVVQDGDVVSYRFNV